MKKIFNYKTFVLILTMIGILVAIISSERIQKMFSKNPELRYKISYSIVLNSEDVKTYSNQRFKYILQKVYNDDRFDTVQPENINSMICYKLEIINTGNKTIAFTDFYKKDPLRINTNGQGLIGVYIDQETPVYVDALIDTDTQLDNILIRFDTIKPEDKICVNFLLDTNYVENIDIYGSTSYCEKIKPFDIETAEHFGSSDEKIELEPINVKVKNILFSIFIVFGFVLMVVFILNIYEQIKKQPKDDSKT